MLLLTWLVELAMMALCVSAFRPYYPLYKCVQDGRCLGGDSKRDIEGQEARSGVLGISSLKIKQRLPMDNLPHDVRIGRYLERLTKKFASRESEVSKRTNAYNIVTAVAPTQTNSAALDQDGTDYSYFTQVKFGSNDTPLWMLMDTGASASWVMGASCASQACQAHNTYGPSDSTTYKATTGLFDISYGTGHVSGAVASDTVSFAGFTLPLSFGVANQTSDDFLHFPFDGIMGLAQNPGSYPTVLEAISSAKVLKSNIFAVNLDRDADGTHDGEINFGAPDTSKYSGSLTYTPLSATNGDWVVAVDGVGVDGKSAGLTGRSAYIDTGTSYIFIPAADAEALHGLISGSQLSSDGTTWSVPCSTTQSVGFTFSGVTYNVSSKDWVGGKAGGPLCTSNIFPGTPVGANSWLLGDTFMKNVYTVFDSDQKRIGFGAKPTTSSASPAASSTASSGGITSFSLQTSTSLLVMTSNGSPATSPASASGSLPSNTMPAGSDSTSESSQLPSKNSTATTFGTSGSSGFNAAITSSSMSPDSTTLSPSSAASTRAAQGSANGSFNVHVVTISSILLAAVAIIT